MAKATSSRFINSSFWQSRNSSIHAVPMREITRYQLNWKSLRKDAVTPVPSKAKSP